MIRVPTAICLMALGIAACDSEGIDRVNPIDNQPVTTQPAVANDPVTNNQSNDANDPVANNDAAADNNTVPETVPVPAPESEAPASDDAGADTDAQQQTDDTGDNSDRDEQSNGEQSNGDQVSDDAGSSTSDGGQTGDDASNDANNNDNGQDDGGQSNEEQTSDEGSNPDGGQVSDDGQVSNDGQVSDDAGSSSSDGGVTNDDDTSNESANDTANDSPDQSASDDQGSEPDRVTDAGDFQSDNAGGSVLRTSTLSAPSQENICTTASNQQNFSDTQAGDFILHNNAWRPFRAFPNYEWTQCIYTNTNGAVVGWNYDWGPGQTGINGSTTASGDFYVRSYPELIYGVKDEFRTSAPKSVTGLPVELASLPNITIDYSFDGPEYGEARTVDASNNPRFPNGTSISGERNIAIESFLYNKDAAGECSEGIVTRNGGSNHTYEIMVWLDAGAERLPAGPADFVTDLTIRGEPYKVYTKGADPRYIAFVAQNPQNSGTVFWNDFVDWAKDNAHRVQERFGARSNSDQIQDDWCVANILVGTEIFWGAGNLDIYNWTITQRR